MSEVEKMFEMWSTTIATMKRTNMKYMDWEKAKKICEEHPNASIWAGLREDMGNTEGQIWEQGKWCHDYVYDQSFWATPILEIYEMNGDEIVSETEVECYTFESHEGTGLPDWWGK